MTSNHMENQTYLLFVVWIDDQLETEKLEKVGTFEEIYNYLVDAYPLLLDEFTRDEVGKKEITVNMFNAYIIPWSESCSPTQASTPRQKISHYDAMKSGVHGHYLIQCDKNGDANMYLYEFTNEKQALEKYDELTHNNRDMVKYNDVYIRDKVYKLYHISRAHDAMTFELMKYTSP